MTFITDLFFWIINKYINKKRHSRSYCIICKILNLQSRCSLINCSVLCYKVKSICLISKCVFTVCVGRSSNEFRVQLGMDTVHHMGLILTPPPSTSYYSEHRHQHRSLFIHLVWAAARRGEREKGQKGQERTERIRSPWFLGFCLCCSVFGFAIFAPEKWRQFETKGPFSKQRVRTRELKKERRRRKKKEVE